MWLTWHKEAYRPRIKYEPTQAARFPEAGHGARASLGAGWRTLRDGAAASRSLSRSYFSNERVSRISHTRGAALFSPQLTFEKISANIFRVFGIVLLLV